MKAEDTSELPGALISLVCDCTEGHRFVIGLLHADVGVRVYAAQVDDETPRDPLWINPEPS